MFFKVKKICGFLIKKKAIRISFYIIASLILLLSLTINLIVFPNINLYKNEIETESSKSLGLKVKIDNIEAGWNIIQPKLSANEIQIEDTDKNKIYLSKTEITLSLFSLLMGNIEISEIKTESNNLVIQKINNIYYANSINLQSSSEDSNILDNAVIKFVSKNVKYNGINAETLTLKWKNNNLEHTFSVNISDINNDKNNIIVEGFFSEKTKSNDSVIEINYEIENIKLEEFENELNDIKGIKGKIKNGNGYITISGDRVSKAYLDVVFETLAVETQKTVEDISFKVNYKDIEGTIFININNLSFQGLDKQDKKIHEITIKADKHLKNIELKAEDLYIEDLSELISKINRNKNIKKLISENNAQGYIKYLDLKLDNEKLFLPNYINIKFKNLTYFKNKKINFSNLSGSLKLDQTGGEYKIVFDNSILAYPDIINTDKIEGIKGIIEGKIKIKEENIEIKNNLKLSNIDLDISGKIEYKANIDRIKNDNDYYGYTKVLATAKINQLQNIYKYMSLKSAELNKWLKEHIILGQADNVKIDIDGNIDSMFNSDTETFKIDSKLLGVNFNTPYIDKKIEGLNGYIVINKDSVELKKLTTNQKNYTIRGDIKANDLSLDKSSYEIKLKYLGDNRELIDLTEHIINLKKILIAKNVLGKNETDAVININSNNEINYSLLSKISNGEGQINNLNLSKINGELKIKNGNIENIDMNLNLFGEPTNLTKINEKIKFTTSINTNQLRKKTNYINKLNINGKAKVEGEFNLQSKILKINSNLEGISLDIKKIWSKNIETKINTTLTINTKDKSIEFKLGDLISSNISYRNNIIGNIVFKNAKITGAEANKLNIYYGGTANLNEIIDIFNGTESGNEIKIENLNIFGGDLIFGNSLYKNIQLKVKNTLNKYNINIKSNEAIGEIQWEPPKNQKGNDFGQIKGVFEKFMITKNIESNKENQLGGYPDLELSVKKLYWFDTYWGEVLLKGNNRRDGDKYIWDLSTLKIQSQNESLTGSMKWVKGEKTNKTYLDINIESKDVGELLSKLGNPKTVKNGTAKAKANLAWNDAPFNYDTRTLNGNFKIESKNGQFLKMDAGAGRLLGLLSLQALPQRFFLDFKDIFGDGLSYEEITGAFNIKEGIMETNDLEMDTSAARILMNGSVNLYKKTQDFKIKVKPNLSNAAAIGVTVINPIAGAATFVAGKIFKDPIGYIFSTVYHVTGTWDNPEVDKKPIKTDK